MYRYCKGLWAALITCVCLLVLSGCDTSGPALLPTPDLAASATAGAAQAQAVQTQVAIQVQVALTAIALSATPTVPPTVTPIPTATPTSTTSPSATPTASPTVVPSSTPTETRAPLPTASPTSAAPAAVPTNTPPPQISGQLAVPICIQPCSELNQREIILASLNGFSAPSTRLLALAATDPSFQEDGRRVVFRSIASSQEGRGEGVFINDLPSNTEIRVDGTPDDHWPIFINNGWVLFSSTRVEENQQKQNRLFIVTRYNAEDVPQSVGPDPITVLKDARIPTYSAAGTIAYSGCVGGGCGIWTTTERGYAPHDACCQITHAASDTSPDWSPDGTRLAFTSRESGSFEIYTVNANGAGRTRLTLSGGTNVAPTWSPDGQWIAYLSDRGGSWAVWLIRPDQPNQIVKLFDINGTIEDAANRRMDWVVRR